MRERATERLRLEPIGPRHAGDLWGMHWDEAVATWYGGRWTARMAQDYAARAARAWDDRGVHKWMAYDRATGGHVGRGGLSYVEIEGRERLEVGWALRSAHWGAGYATEIGRAGLAFAFDHLGADEVIAFTERRNTRSVAVMRRLGMRFEGEIGYAGAPFVLYRAARPPAAR